MASSNGFVNKIIKLENRNFSLRIQKFENGYFVSVSEDNDIFSFLPGELTEGQVTITGSRKWTESNREHNINFAMDAQTGRMLAWAEIIG